MNETIPPSIAKQHDAATPANPESAHKIFVTFLRLGLVSFGGPIAHLAYFERAFVQMRGWLTASQFAQLLTLCQFLPGPASSQMGFAIGLTRGGLKGGLAAFVGFTLPSALMMFAAALAVASLQGEVAQAAIHGLKLVAVVVVAVGVMNLAQKLTPDAPRAMLAAAVAALVLLAPSAWYQLLAVAVAAVIGALFINASLPRSDVALTLHHGMRPAVVCLVLFVVLLIGLPFAAAMMQSPGLDVADAFYRAGALVFGGGHVVLPLLEESVVAPGWMSEDTFLAGYGAAQAVPGPMFTLASFLGASTENLGGAGGATIALLAIFLPGMLLVTGVLPFWQRVAASPRAARALAGVNAAVIGLLAAALYDPVWTSAILLPVDFAIALFGFVLLVAAKRSALWAVAWCVLAAIGAQLLGLR